MSEFYHMRKYPTPHEFLKEAAEAGEHVTAMHINILSAYVEWRGKKLTERRACLECLNFVDDQYMVHDAAWLAAVPTKDGHLHLKCLAKRLGRKLTLDDLQELPINEPFRCFDG